MTGDEDQLRACVYTTAEVIRRRRRTGEPVPAWLHENLDWCERRLAVARSGHEFTEIVYGDAQLATDTELIDATTAGKILGFSKRTMVRRDTEFGGTKVGGAGYVFRRSAIERRARERAEDVCWPKCGDQPAARSDRAVDQRHDPV